jgi:hypothetical protein
LLFYLYFSLLDYIVFSLKSHKKKKFKEKKIYISKFAAWANDLKLSLLFIFYYLFGFFIFLWKKRFSFCFNLENLLEMKLDDSNQKKKKGSF